MSEVMDSNIPVVAQLTEQPIVTKEDIFWRGALKIRQPARGHGYRFNIDSVLLAAFVPAVETVVDLGCGCGIMPLLLLKSGKAKQVHAIDIQEEMVAICRYNAQGNGLVDCLHVQHFDVRHLALHHLAVEHRNNTVLKPVDMVVFNPPYYPQNSQKPKKNRCEDIACREIGIELEDFIACSRRLIQEEGIVACVLPLSRMPSAVKSFKKSGFQRIICRKIKTLIHKPIRHVLLMAKGLSQPALPLEMIEEETLLLHPQPGIYHPEIQPWLDGGVAV